jgi:hypothetical protein
MGKKSRSGSEMNNQDHISESLETIFWVKILKFFFDADPGSRIRDEKNSEPGSWMEKFGSVIRDKHPGFATLLLNISFIPVSQRLSFAQATSQ